MSELEKLLTKPAKQREQADLLCRVIWEMAENAPHDLIGEHRDFYLPRIQKALLAIGVLYPIPLARAAAKDVAP